MNEQIINWVREQEKSNFTPEQIYSSLLQNGYTSEQAKLTINLANNPNTNIQNINLNSQNNKPLENKSLINSKELFKSRNILMMFLIDIFTFGTGDHIFLNKIFSISEKNNFIDPKDKKNKESKELIYVSIFITILLFLIITFQQIINISIASNNNILTRFISNNELRIALEMGLLDTIFLITILFLLICLYGIQFIISSRIKEILNKIYPNLKIPLKDILLLSYGIQKNINKINNNSK